MPNILSNSMVDTKIMNLLIANYINLFFDLGRSGGHFGFLRFTLTFLKFKRAPRLKLISEHHAQFAVFIRHVTIIWLSYLTLGLVFSSYNSLYFVGLGLVEMAKLSFTRLPRPGWEFHRCVEFVTKDSPILMFKHIICFH